MEDRNEKIFDTLLEIAVEEALLQEISGMPSCEELDKIYTPSPAMDKRIRRIISRHELSKNANAFFKITGKAAAGFLVLLGISATVIFSVDASRNYVINSFIQWYDNHTSVQFHTNENLSLFDKYSFNYIPEGFTITNSFFDNVKKTYVFTNDDGENIILILTSSYTSDLEIDNEKSDFSLIKIHNQDAFLFEGKSDDEVNTVIWKNDDVIFELLSNLNKTQLISMAENTLKN
ncbi:MAG: DUF4367 domain-containing protein [Clostridiales bacterium]|jgi:hypothetical protein|nr:DUF4367 domain-containing protein [Clostridiales bacterium]